VKTGRYCTWCKLEEIRPDETDRNEWLNQPRGCCAPDGDGHLWVFPYGYSRQNPPPNNACTKTSLSAGGNAGANVKSAGANNRPDNQSASA